MGLFSDKDDKKTELVETANKLIEQGDAAGALKKLQEALVIDPGFKKAHTTMGYLFSDLGQYNEAIQIFRKILKIDDSCPDAWNNLGLTYARCELYQDAIRTFLDAISLDPKNATHHNNLGNVHFELGQYDQAMKLFQIAMELDPSYSETYNRMGIDKVSAGNMDNALQKLKEAAKTGKNKAKVAYDMGTLYVRQDLLENAIRSFKDAVRMEPAFEEAFIALGFAYERKGDLPKALETFQWVMKLEPRSAKLHNTVGLLYDKLGKHPQAVLEYRVAIELEPNYSNAHFLLGQVYENKGLAGKAVDEYGKFIRIHETGPKVEEAKALIAKIRGIGPAEVEVLLDQKRKDTPTESYKAGSRVPPMRSIAADQAPSGVKLMDPKEYLKQVLAKAKAAKSLGAPSTETKAGPSTPTAQPVMGTQPVTAPFLPITPLPSPVPASETFQSNELELLNAITQVDANSAEEEEQVLEAVESISSEAMIHDFEKTHPQYPAAIHDADLLPTLTK